MQKYNSNTQLTNLGRKVDYYDNTVNPPVMHASTILFETYEEFKQAEIGKYDKTTYGRYGTATNRTMAKMIADLEGAEHAWLTSSGVSAIAIALLSFVQNGDHILLSDNVYGPTRLLYNKMLKGFGVKADYFDPMIGADIERLIRPETKVVFLESPGSLSFEVCDIPAISKAAHQAGAVVISDNTWATPLYMKPFDLGVDVSIHSATKYIGGHSDLLMGTISCQEEHYNNIALKFKIMGSAPSPDDVYLAHRGLRTLAARLAMHSKNALEVANWIAQYWQEHSEQGCVILHPAFPECPGHEFWKRDFTGASSLFSIVLPDGYSEKQLANMLDGMKLFKMGYSWGGYESLIIPLLSMDTLRTASKWHYKGRHAVRIYVGLEDVGDLIADLEAGFARLKI